MSQTADAHGDNLNNDLKRELEKKAHGAIRRSMQGRKYRYRKWSWDQIEKGEQYNLCTGIPYPWLPNVIKPSWWCKTLHWFWWCDDWHRWQGTSFPYYHMLCRRCGRCWMKIRWLEWFLDK